MAPAAAPKPAGGPPSDQMVREFRGLQTSKQTAAWAAKQWPDIQWHRIEKADSLVARGMVASVMQAVSRYPVLRDDLAVTVGAPYTQEGGYRRLGQKVSKKAYAHYVAPHQVGRFEYDAATGEMGHKTKTEPGYIQFNPAHAKDDVKLEHSVRFDRMSGFHVQNEQGAAGAITLHELGHHAMAVLKQDPLGSHAVAEWMRDTRDVATPPVSVYAKKNPNERFAETFEAVVARKIGTRTAPVHPHETAMEPVLEVLANMERRPKE